MKFVIFNADDFGYGHAVNRGIAEAHETGVVTATTLVVNGVAVDEAVAIARQRPGLSVGLHVNFTNEAQRLFDIEDPGRVRDELQRQFDRFCELMGRKPAHLELFVCQRGLDRPGIRALGGHEREHRTAPHMSRLCLFLSGADNPAETFDRRSLERPELPVQTSQ